MWSCVIYTVCLCESDLIGVYMFLCICVYLYMVASPFAQIDCRRVWLALSELVAPSYSYFNSP